MYRHVKILYEIQSRSKYSAEYFLTVTRIKCWQMSHMLSGTLMFIKTEIFSDVSYDSSVMSKTSQEFCCLWKRWPTSPAAEQLPTPVFIGVRVFHKTLGNFPCTITKYAITWLPTLPWIKSQPGVWVTPLFYTVWCSSFRFTCTMNRNVFKIFATLRDISLDLSTLL